MIYVFKLEVESLVMKMNLYDCIVFSKKVFQNITD